MASAWTRGSWWSCIMAQAHKKEERAIHIVVVFPCSSGPIVVMRADNTFPIHWCTSETETIINFQQFSNLWKIKKLFLALTEIRIKKLNNIKSDEAERIIVFFGITLFTRKRCCNGCAALYLYCTLRAVFEVFYLQRSLEYTRKYGWCYINRRGRMRVSNKVTSSAKSAKRIGAIY